MVHAVAGSRVARPVSTPPAVHVAVLSDTHVRPGAHTLPRDAWHEIERADVVLHAGDVLTEELLTELALFAPVHAVLGNNDHDLRGILPERIELELGGVRVAMVHDSGLSSGRETRLRRWFPSADVVIFGHSHEPTDYLTDDGMLLFNPGSPTQRRRQPRPTMGVLDLHDGVVSGHRVFAVGH